jgi:hypothetical protein
MRRLPFVKNHDYGCGFLARRASLIGGSLNCNSHRSIAQIIGHCTSRLSHCAEAYPIAVKDVSGSVFFLLIFLEISCVTSSITHHAVQILCTSPPSVFTEFVNLCHLTVMEI